MESEGGTLEALASAIMRHTDALAHLRFKFEVQQMVLAGGRPHYLNETTSELTEAIAGVQSCDAQFRGALSAAAIELGMSPESTLREVAAAVGEPWRYIFIQAREDLRRAIDRVGDLCEENRKLLARGFVAIGEALSLLGVAPSGVSYDATGTAVRASSAATILNMRA